MEDLVRSRRLIDVTCPTADDLKPTGEGRPSRRLGMW